MSSVIRVAVKRFLVSACGVFALCAPGHAARADGGDRGVLRRHSLIVSTTKYDASRGPAASLKVGTPLANTATATTPAIAGNDYVNVWNNAAVDGSFSVTSAIELLAVEPHSGKVLERVRVPEDEVVTSFSSKSELGLHYAKDEDGGHIVFVGYAGAGVGNIDLRGPA